MTRKLQIRLQTSLPDQWFGINEVQPVERMPLVFDPAIHMRSAILARVRRDRRAGDVFLADNSNLGENRVLGLPALGATKDLIVRDLRTDSYFNRVFGAKALDRPASKAGRAFLTPLSTDGWKREYPFVPPMLRLAYSVSTCG